MSRLLRSHLVIIIAIPLFIFFSSQPVSAALNGTETIITTDTVGTVQYSPAISGNWIAWVRDIESPPATQNKFVYVYKVESGEEFAVSPVSGFWETVPSIDGNTIVWFSDDAATTQIAAFDLISKTQINANAIIATPGNYVTYADQNVFPKISMGNITWQNYGSNQWDVYWYNLTDIGVIHQDIANPLYDEKYPAIYGNYIAYENWSGGSSDIYLYNISNSTAVRISSDSGKDETPAIYGTKIVWQGIDSGTGNKIINFYDFGSGISQQITPAGSAFDQTNPDIFGDFVVVEDNRESPGYTDIYLYNLADGSERWLTPGSAGKKITPAISGDRIVWEDFRNEGGSDTDIYMLTLGTPETCPIADFSANPQGGSTPAGVITDVKITFTDSSTPGPGGITHRVWNFSDGTLWENNPSLLVTHHFITAGIYPVKLTVSNQKCRNVSTGLCSHSIYIDNPPVADFTATPGEGLAPLTVNLIDTSCGAPASWSWNFGDGTSFSGNNPGAHTFSDTGKQYTVTLTATNTQGSSTKSNIVRTLMGAQDTATTPISGITIDNRFGGSFLTFDSLALPSFSPNPLSPYMMTKPPQNYKWGNISFFTSDGIGFRPAFPNNTYFANISRFYLKTNDTIANAVGTPPPIGTGWGVNYQLNTTTYPSPASVQTYIREGASQTDGTFDDIAARVSPSGTLVRNIGYTAKVTKQNLGNEGISIINMSVAQSWVRGSYGTVAIGRDYTYIMGYGYDTEGNKRGGILSKRLVFTDPDSGLDYYEADIPENASYLSTFALAHLSGSGNVFQMVYLGVVQHFVDIQSSTDSSYGLVAGTAKGSGQGLTSKQDQQAAPAPEAKSVDLFINDQAVVTQTTILQSPDQLATLSIGQGVVAKDSAKNPLSSVTIASASMSASGIPESLQGSTFRFAGIAYNLQPDGATFSPAATITFTVPQAQWSQHYMVKEWDPLAQVWVDLPTTYHPESGTISASVSNFCIIALFSDTITPSPTPPRITVQTPLPTIAPPQPTSPFSIFYGMVAWLADMIMKNLYLFLIVAAIVVAFYINRRRKGRDPLRFK